MTKLVDVKTQGTKELNEVGEALKGIMTATKAALKDGWQPGTDLPLIVTSAFASLPKAIEGLSQVGQEVKDFPVQAVMGALVPVAEGVGELISGDKSGE
jgi:hypothetical protein